MICGLVVSLLIGYVLGSVPFSYLAGRLRGVDLRDHGSGNLGASNAYRVLGAGYAVPVLVLDIAKGGAAVLLAAVVASRMGWEPTAWHRSLAALGAIVGHIWTVFLGFRGGKGVATAAGAFAALTPLPLVISLAVWTGVVAATRYVSLGSMSGAVTLPIAVYLANRSAGIPAAEFWLALAVAIVVLARHRSNIRRLLDGNENRLTRIGKESTS